MLMVFKGKTADDEEVSGTITVPEVAHDTEENEYVVCVLIPGRSRGPY
jgi:activator of HSP90 ATPase